jgi:hypothetical protein
MLSDKRSNGKVGNREPAESWFLELIYDSAHEIQHGLVHDQFYYVIERLLYNVLATLRFFARDE